MDEIKDLVNAVINLSNIMGEMNAGHHYTAMQTITALEKMNERISAVEAELGNDVCEWKDEKGMFIQNPHTGRKFSNEPSMKNVYCNTCGKKIKVVE